jgi:hypothetical protein
MKNHIRAVATSSAKPLITRVRQERERTSASRIQIEPLEGRVYLSIGVTAPRLGCATLFHTPLPPDAPGDVFVPRLAAPPPGTSVILSLDGGVVVFLTNESAQGKDLNRDGDRCDNVLQSFDPETGVHNSRQQAVADSLIDIGDGLVAFLTDEAAQGKRLNRDHDRHDQVLQVMDARTGEVRNSHSSAVSGSVVAMEGGLVAFATREFSENRSLNGDGDRLDAVLQIFDFHANEVINTGQAVNIPSSPLSAL